MAVVATNLKWNGASYSADPQSLPAVRESGALSSINNYIVSSVLMSVMGTNDGSTSQANCNQFNRASWSSASSVSGTSRKRVAAASAFGFFYLICGNNGGTANATCDKWNNASWAVATNPMTTALQACSGAFVKELGLAYFSAGAPLADENRSMNAAETGASISTSSKTVTGQTSLSFNGKFYKVGGDSVGDLSVCTATQSSYNGSWSTAEASMATGRAFAATALHQNYMKVLGGRTSGGAAQTSVERYNGATWTSATEPALSAASYESSGCGVA